MVSASTGGPPRTEQQPRRLDAVDALHPQIHHHHVGPMPRNGIGHLVAIGAFSDDHETVLAAQDPAQSGAHQILVVDEQDRDLGRVVGHDPQAQVRWPLPVSPNGISALTDHPSSAGPISMRPAEQFDALTHAAQAAAFRCLRGRPQ